MSNRMNSWVWNYATIADDKKSATCNLCNKSISYSNSPSAISNHLKSIHKRSPLDISTTEPSENHDASSSSSLSASTLSFTESQEYHIPRKRQRRNDGSGLCSAQRQEVITEATAKLIATNLLPISLVSTSGFRDFMDVLEPGYKVPCEKTILRRLECYFEEVKLKIKKDLSKAQKVSLTTDEWSSRAQNSYLSVEAQYLDENCKMHHATLCNEVLFARPTALNISNELKTVIKDWDLENKVEAIVHDSASAIIAACNLLPEIPYSVKCNAHLLQLVVHDCFAAVPDYESLTSKGQAVVSHFRRSNIASNSLAQRQIQMDMKKEKLIQSCNTRWDSKYFMFESLVQNKTPISAVLADRQVTKRDVTQKLEITESNWVDMEKLLVMLKAFQVATTIFCSQTDVTISVVRPVIHSIISNHLATTPEDNAVSKKFKKEANSSLKRRFRFEENDFEIDIMHISQFFDPRHKSLSCESAEMKQEVVDYVKGLLNVGEPMDTEDTNSPVPKSSAFDFLFGSEIPASNWQSQLQMYMAEPELGRNLDPLQWWKNHSDKYSLIFKLALQFLSVPATSAASERTFSSAGNIVTPNRNCLGPNNVNLLTFLYQNRHFMADR
ncbi:E3 SUMO-protein ligase ZBED1-like [Phymastichus coffea]|uniref:E3 SUMO-protein ligase ZBED1-like n=1 Tax=Phymastichus coffea TaxID=108790 RepID=UPI00273BBD5F|nr:E3 SUMO-protein ligase ZBED1-like [Phymastichus coffea]